MHKPGTAPGRWHQLLNGKRPHQSGVSHWAHIKPSQKGNSGAQAKGNLRTGRVHFEMTDSRPAEDDNKKNAPDKTGVFWRYMAQN